MHTRQLLSSLLVKLISINVQVQVLQATSYFGHKKGHFVAKAQLKQYFAFPILNFISLGSPVMIAPFERENYLPIKRPARNTIRRWPLGAFPGHALPSPLLLGC